jgi:hypothetical protein
MLRRSSRRSNAHESEKIPTTKKNPQHKRAASQTENKSHDSKKVKKLQATPTKSQYFHSDEDSEAADEDQHSIEETTSDDNAGGSDFADESASVVSDIESVSNDESDASDDEPTPRKGKGKGKPSPGTLRSANSEVWRSGVKTGLGPGREVIIKKPKARPAGNVPYQEDTIHPNTLLFLEELKNNNDREWLKSMYFSNSKERASVYFTGLPNVPSTCIASSTSILSCCTATHNQCNSDISSQPWNRHCLLTGIFAQCTMPTFEPRKGIGTALWRN